MFSFKKPCFVIFLILLLPAVRLRAQPVFDFNSQCEQAYREIFRMKMNEGKRLLDREKRLHPDNLIPYFLENYIDLFKLFFNGDHSDYESYLADSENRLDRLEKGPSASPYYLFVQSMINLQTAACKYKFGDDIGCLWSLRKAYLQIQQNNRKFPDFTPNKVILGPMKAFIGSIPSNYRWAVRLAGFKDGSVSEGLHILYTYLEDQSPQGRLFQSEAVFYYVYLIFYLKHRPDQAIAVIENRKLDVVHNALYAFMAANLYLNNHAAEKGKQILRQRETGPEYLDMPVIHYELGMMQLYHLQLDAAIREFGLFLDHYKGKIYAKDALYKLSWAYYLKGDHEKAAHYRQEVLKRGSEVTDADKVAVREVEAQDWPDATILKARLLLTGGYLEEALRTILSKNISDYAALSDKIKYSYFLARIRDELGQEDQALLLYKATIEGGHDRPEYYAARAALQTAFVYEKRKDTAQALRYFKKCLNMPEEEYKQTLDQRAKSGINRLKTK